MVSMKSMQSLLKKFFKREISNSRKISLSEFGFKNSGAISLEKSVFYSSGREAVVCLIRALRLNNESIALLPDFCPEGIVDPFKRSGVSIVYYPIDDELRPIHQNFLEIIESNSPSICFLIHYFGLLQDDKKLSAICKERGIILVEDFAHFLPLNKSNYGLNSDLSLFSFDKVLPVPDGAELKINNIKININDFFYHKSMIRNFYIALKFINLLVMRITQFIPPFLLWRRVGSFLTRIDTYKILMSYYFKYQCKMSFLSRLIVRKIKIKKIISIRAQNEMIYKKNLNGEVFKSFAAFNPAKHFCRMGYPVKVEMRESLIKFLYEHGITGVFFKNKWSFANLNNATHKNCLYILESNFLFPTSSSLTEKEIHYVISIANMWASKYAQNKIII
jgi:dTDP-4-amino-4,6-dideoxygalactose transaminase